MPLLDRCFEKEYESWVKKKRDPPREREERIQPSKPRGRGTMRYVREAETSDSVRLQRDVGLLAVCFVGCRLSLGPFVPHR